MLAHLDVTGMLGSTEKCGRSKPNITCTSRKCSQLTACAESCRKYFRKQRKELSEVTSDCRVKIKPNWHNDATMQASDSDRQNYCVIMQHNTTDYQFFQSQLLAAE